MKNCSNSQEEEKEKQINTPLYPILAFPQFWMVMVWSTAPRVAVPCKSLFGESPK